MTLKFDEPAPTYRLLISGPGRTGKSHIIKLIHDDTKRLLRRSGHFEPDDVLILLTAFTGPATFNRDGMTLHSTFLLGAGAKQHTYQA